MHEPSPKGIKPPEAALTALSQFEKTAQRVAHGGTLTPEEEAVMLGRLLGPTVNKNNVDPTIKAMGEDFLKRHPEMTDTFLDTVAQYQNTNPDTTEEP